MRRLCISTQEHFSECTLIKKNLLRVLCQMDTSKRCGKEIKYWVGIPGPPLLPRKRPRSLAIFVVFGEDMHLF